MMFAFFKHLSFEALSKPDTSFVMPNERWLEEPPQPASSQILSWKEEYATTVHPIVRENKDGSVAFFLLKESEAKQASCSFWYQPNWIEKLGP